ncbi:hypothetical protein HU200_048852 [Digitaria exilis]|uniref:Uncharacterized protein n=1 Tax=Digitaria exilis TaxID=1010633 RepID=A0A835AUV5_9POAL|nr:hypothetical protein HU200_048852 [Digitaria exilis]
MWTVRTRRRNPFPNPDAWQWQHHSFIHAIGVYANPTQQELGHEPTALTMTWSRSRTAY